MSRVPYLVQNLPWLVVGAIVLAVLIFRAKLIHHRRLYSNLPTPPFGLLWGNLKVMGEAVKKFPPRTYIGPIFADIAKTYSLEGLFYLDLWPFAQPFLVITDPDLALQVQTSPYVTRHRTSADTLGGLTGTESIFSLHGKEWQQQRAWFAPAFSLSHLLALVPGMVEEVLIFKESLTKFAVSNETFSMADELVKLTMDVIGRSVGDIRLNSQTGYSGIRAWFQKTTEWTKGYGEPFWVPILRPLMHPWCSKKLDSLLVPIIKQKLAEASRSGTEKSILSLAQKGYLKYKAGKNDGSTRIDNDKKFLKIALDNVKTFFTAGSETTSSSAAYMYYLVSTHPEILSRVRAEHDEFLGVDLDTTIATLTNTPEVLNKLTLTNAVLKETLRLFPIGVVIREAAPGATIDYKGRTYPLANNMITTSIHHMHRSPNSWSDPNAFDPDRWIDPEKRDDGKENGSWQPFDKGPRNCIGQQLALIEMKVIAALTLRWFDFETRYEAGAPELPGWGGAAYQIWKLTARPVEGLPMVVKLRDV